MKIAAMMLGLVLAMTSQAQAYETDDFGFPMRPGSNRGASYSNYSVQRTSAYRGARVNRARYCPPAVARVQAQPVRTLAVTRSTPAVTKVATVKAATEVKAAAKPVAKATLTAVPSPKSQPAS